MRFLMISEDFLKLISDSQQLMHTEASLKPRRKVIRRVKSSRSTEGSLRPTEDLLRHVDGTLKSILSYSSFKLSDI